jgi:hypothetical protein
MNAVSSPALAAAPRRTIALVAMFVAFQGGWFACVLGAAHGWPWAGTLAAASVTALWIGLGARPMADAVLVAAAIAIGFVWDSAMAKLGLIAYAKPGALSAPVWILALWALFAVTLRESLRVLHTRLPLAALLGAVGGPLSYAAAARMGACELIEPVQTPLVLALGWAAITPLLLALARRLDRERALAADAR